MSPAPAPEAPYEALEAVIASELALVRRGELSALRTIKRERGAIITQLPATPPVQARATLQRCRALQDEIARELMRARETVLDDLQRVLRARRAAAGYAPQRPSRPRVSARA